MRRFGFITSLALGLAGWLRTTQPALIVFNPASWVEGHTPRDWHVKVNHGRPEFDSCADATGPCVRFKSADSSFGLERSVDVNPHETRFLAWRWKVTRLPEGGDFRRPVTDDQAAQILVGFSDRRVLSYIWDTSAPKGATGSSSAYLLLHIHAIVCESGPLQTGRWLSEARDVAADYERAYGKSAPHISGLRLQINSQHTGTAAESYFGEVAFLNQLP